MRKNNYCSFDKKTSIIFDTIFWGFISVIPLIAYLVCVLKNITVGVQEYPYMFNPFFANLFYFSDSWLFNIIDTAISFLGVNCDFLVYYVVYYIYVQFMHFIVDLLLLVVRLIHKLIDEVV